MKNEPFPTINSDYFATLLGDMFFRAYDIAVRNCSEQDLDAVVTFWAPTLAPEKRECFREWIAAIRAAKAKRSARDRRLVPHTILADQAEEAGGDEPIPADDDALRRQWDQAAADLAIADDLVAHQKEWLADEPDSQDARDALQQAEAEAALASAAYAAIVAELALKAPLAPDRSRP